ncbi:MAG TPA: tetratricopeptide repeat protein [Pyrinomonadaceae bacterium]
MLKKSEEFSLNNKIPEAIAELSKAILIRPDDASLYLQRAELYFGVPNYKLVSQDVKKAVELKPGNKQTVLTAARFLRNIRDCAESLNLINSYINNHPESDDVIYARAHSRMCLGEWMEAYADMSTAVRLAPQNSHYRTTQIGLLSKIGYDDLSADQFEQFLTTLKESYSKADFQTERENFGRQISELYRVRAGTHHAKKNETAEFADLAESINYYKKDFNYRMRAKIYFDHQMYEKALEDYTKAIELSPKDSLFRVERADVYVLAGKFDEALKDYAEAVKLDRGLSEIVEAKKKWAAEKLKQK